MALFSTGNGLQPSRLYPIECIHCASAPLCSKGNVHPVTHLRTARTAFRLLLLAVFLLAALRPAGAYSLLSHEEIVDMAWPQYILPLLQQRYPGLTPDQLTECHAYAYGGSVIQDMGYYPFGSKQFSNLLHYVRSGDFVDALLRDSTTPDEYAFALGAMSHYYGDTVGHLTVNVITGEEYPSLRSRFGRFVTYGDNETAHLRNEYGFDVVEVAHGAYSQQNYHDFIGFQVAEPLMNRAFEETYGLPIDDVLKHEDLSISSYRYSVSKLIPKMTRVAIAGYGDQIQKATPSFAKDKFIYRLRRTDFEKEYGKQYMHPDFRDRVVAFLLANVPKVGPFKALKLHLPNSAQQTQYLASFNAVETAYRAEVTTVAAAPAADPPALPELDFDTGAPTADGEYKLADQTYAVLIEQLAGKKNAQLSPLLLADINHFYANPSAPDVLKATPQKWAKLQAALATVRQMPVMAPAVATPAATTSISMR